MEGDTCNKNDLELHAIIRIKVCSSFFFFFFFFFMAVMQYSDYKQPGEEQVHLAYSS
jgi:hypothetical protein